MPRTVDEAIQLLQVTPTLIRSSVATVSQEVLAGTEPDVWGARQVLEHLIDTESIAFRDRIGSILNEDRPYILSIDPPSRLQEGGYAERTLDDLVSTFESLRAQSITWLSTIDEGDFDREGEHEVAGVIRVGELLHYWAVHDLTHLSQFMTALRAQ
ncbi:hypothetical protein BH23ACT12_BH23ACT12_10620 [soil metagenome]